MITKATMKPYRTTATVVGVVYLAGFVVGIAGNILIQSILGVPNPLATLSANSMTVAIGALLWLLAVAGDAAHGVLMFPVLKPHGERLAVGYLAARIMDALFVAIMVIFILLQIPLGSEYLKAAAPDAAYLQALSALLTQGQLYAYEIGDFVQLRRATFQLPASAASELKVWVHRVTPEGNSERLPAQIQVIDAQTTRTVDLLAEGGQTILPVQPQRYQVQITLG